MTTQNLFVESGNSSPSVELRPYQKSILDAILNNYRKGVRRMIVSAATGTGKNLCMAQVPSLLRSELSGQVLVLTHTEELLEQSAEEFRRSNPDLIVSIEMAERCADAGADIIVASVPTLGRAQTKRRDKFNWANISVCITDEAHHSTSKSYVNIFEAGGFLEANTEKLLVGFTATPNRADGTPLKDIYEKIVYTYPLRQGIQEGYLSPITGVRVNTQTDLDDVHTINGEFKIQELADTVNTVERNNLVVEHWKQEASSRKTVVFAVNVQHAVDLAACFREHGVAAEAIWGEDPQRADKLARYKAGETLVLTNCAVLTEGWNSPEISCVCLARPTKSSLLFQQMIGRGTRLFPGKENCIILDVVDTTKKHSLTTLASLLGFPHDMKLHGMSAVKAIGILEDMQKRYPHINLEDLRDINKLEEYIESVNLFEVTYAPEVLEHSQLSWFHTSEGWVLSLPHGNRATITTNLLGKFESKVELAGQVHVHTGDTLADAFQTTDWFLNSKCSSDIALVTREQKKWHADGATEAQLTAIRRAYPGKAVPQTLTKGQASKLISQVKASAPVEPATSKQLGYLRWQRIAVPPNCSKATAGQLITEHRRGQR